MRYIFLILPVFLFLGCDSIGLGGSYPSIYTQNSPECGCDGVMYKITNPNLTAQKVTVVRVRQSGTAPKRRENIEVTLQPKIEKRLGCSEINLYITGRSEFCDTHQSFYVKKYRELKSTKK
jgi:hypothetical protein